jgi:anthranilate synthase component 1
MNKGLKSQKEVQRAFNQGYNVVSLVRAVPEDTITPVEASLRLNPNGEPSFLLESVEGGERMARYSFLGARPFESISVKEGKVISDGPRGQTVLNADNPYKELGCQLLRFRALREPGLPRFCGGAVGFVGYEMFRYLEPCVSLKPSEGDEARFMLFANVVVFDRVRHRMFLIANVVDGSGSLSQRYRAAEKSLDDMELLLSRPSKSARLQTIRTGALKPTKNADMAFVNSSLGERGYCDAVLRLKKHIRAGNIFQAVPSNRFELTLKAEPFTVYRMLRAINPSPYMFYMDFGNRVALGASPEMLLRSEDGNLETRPIAGTRPRGKTEDEDLRNERNLMASVKEKAEHLMLVDLGRNDIGRVARPSTVTVPSLMQVERYSHVMHIVSSVRGKLKQGLSPWEALGSCFPAGTVTGAPKIRAMQLLSEIEPVPRGLYAGAAVYCDFSGNVDSAIAIRSLSVLRNRRGLTAYIQAGGGVVADSNPEREYQEARNKARAMFEAVRSAEAVR